MNWFYASGGQQMGPVDEAALDDLVRQGVVRDDTLVWRQGLPGWQPHGTARPRPAAPPPAAVAPVPPPPASPAPSSPASGGWAGSQPSAPAAAAPVEESRFCSNCGRPTPVSQLTTVSGASICAACLPTVSGAGAAAAQQPAYQQAPQYQQAPAYPAPGAYAPAGGYQQGFIPGQSIPGQTRYGGFWIRFLARFIDGILLGIISAIIRLPLALVMGGIGVGLSRAQDPAAALAALPALFGVIGLTILINFAVSFCYEVYFLSSRGATPGKMALGLKVVRADGGPISMGLAAGRYFAYLLSFFTFLIGFIIAGFDDEKRSLHDRICNTRVIKL